MNIAHLSLQDWEKDFLKNNLSDQNHTFLNYNDLMTTNLEQIEVLTVFIYDKITKQILAKMPNLKLIVTRSTGFDHIDLIATKTQNILISNVPSYGENTIAEHAFALLLGLARHLPEIARRSNECRFDYSDLRGFDLSGKKIGIIGAGKIGLHAIKIAKGFGMKVQAYDVFENHFLSEVLGFEYASLDTILANSDVISIHAPYMPATHHLLNAESFAKMKKGMILINTARGAIIETQALDMALENGTVAAAGLDVVESEEDLLNCNENAFLENLVKRKNVIFTPHSAYFTKESQERILHTTIENITKFQNQKPQNVIK